MTKRKMVPMNDFTKPFILKHLKAVDALQLAGAKFKELMEPAEEESEPPTPKKP